MKIKCYIASFSCPDYFYKVINTFAKYPHEVDFVLYVADTIDSNRLPKNRTDIKLFEKSIGHKLVHQYYDDIKASVDNYDVFIFTEDDMEITPATFETFMRLNKELDDDQTIGFMRYEICDDKFYMNEFQPGTPHSIAPQPRKIRGKWYVSYQNIHQGCFVLEKRNLKYLLSNPEFVAHWPQNTVMLEDAASNVYKSTWPGSPTGLEKLYPVDEIPNLVIHHLSNRHTTITKNFLQLHQVEQEAKLCLTRLPLQ